MVKELKDEYLEKVISFSLGFSEAYIERFFESEIIGNRCVIENREYENCDTGESFILANKRQKELCKRYGAKYFEINEDYIKEINLVCSWVDNAILCHGHTP
jgi:hypothetical protein